MATRDHTVMLKKAATPKMAKVLPPDWHACRAGGVPRHAEEPIHSGR